MRRVSVWTCEDSGGRSQDVARVGEGRGRGRWRGPRWGYLSLNEAPALALVDDVLLDERGPVHADGREQDVPATNQCRRVRTSRAKGSAHVRRLAKHPACHPPPFPASEETYRATPAPTRCLDEWNSRV